MKFAKILFIFLFVFSCVVACEKTESVPTALETEVPTQETTNQTPTSVINTPVTVEASQITRQIDMIVDFVPGLKKLGISHASGSADALSQVETAIAYAQSLGLEVVSNSNAFAGETMQNLLNFASVVDAVWIPSDNSIADDMPIVGQVSIDLGVPIFVGDDSMVKGGGLAATSAASNEYIVNGFIAESLGIEIPAKYVDYIWFAD